MQPGCLPHIFSAGLRFPRVLPKQPNGNLQPILFELVPFLGQPRVGHDPEVLTAYQVGRQNAYHTQHVNACQPAHVEI